MASKTCSSLALFLALNLLFFSLVSAACGTCRGRYPNPNPRNPNPNPRNPNPNPNPNNPNPNPNNPNPNNPNPNNPNPNNPNPNNPNPNNPNPNPNNPNPNNPNPNNPNPNNPNPNNPNPNNPNPNNPNPNNPNPGASCPRDALKLGVCANVLQGLLNVTIGQPPVTPCCTLIQGLADLEAAVCLCTAIRANILGINLNIPISLSLLLNVCSRQAPRNFQCA